MAGKNADWMTVIDPKVKAPKRRDSVYREGKIAAHSTIGGKGWVARIRRKGKP